jgi:uncharacterized membrane protein (DUF373 family)
VRRAGSNHERRDRSTVAALLAYCELFLDTAVAVALAAGGVVLLAAVIADFVRTVGHEAVISGALRLLSGLLLVFIYTELISTLRVIIDRKRIEVEPFLIVGIVAAIRRLLVIGAEAENVLGTDAFADVMLEVAVLAGTVLVLGVTVLLVRVSARRDRDDSPAPGPARGPAEGPAPAEK